MQDGGSYDEHHERENSRTTQSCQFHGRLVEINPVVLETDAIGPPVRRASPRRT